MLIWTEFLTYVFEVSLDVHLFQSIGEDHAMAQDGILAQAQRVASLLTEAWNEELGEAFIDTDVATGMALGHAVSQGWIEPDPSFAPFLIGAERFLQSGGEAIDDD